MPAEHNALPRALSLAVHELRTPVTVVSGYLRMLLREQAGPISEKQRKMLEEAERSCVRISALVSEMSDLGKLESGDLAVARQPFDFARLVVELASGMHEGHDRGVTLEVRGAGEPLEVVGDRARLGAAIGALLHATLRERGDAGVVVAHCARSDAGGNWAVLAVGGESDVAPLLAAQNASGFDEWRGGLGLALPVARRVVAAHGGTMWSASGERPRAGSAMRIPLNVRAPGA